MNCRLFLLLLIFVGSGSAVSYDLQLIRTDTISNASSISSIEPLTSSGRHVEGYILLFESEQAIHVKWLNQRPQVVIPMNVLPVETASHYSGDTLIIYAIAAAEDMSGMLTLTRVLLVDSEYVASTLELHTPACLGGVGFDSLVTSLHLSRNALGECQGVIVSSTEWASSIYGLEPEYARCSYSWIIAPDLSQIQHDGRYTQLAPGNFTSSNSAQYAGFYNRWYQTWIEYEGPFGWTRDEVVNIDNYLRIFEVSDSLIDTVYVRLTHSGMAFGIFPVEASEGHPFHELIYYAHGKPLNDSGADTHFLGCYNFSSGQPEQIWLLPVNWQSWPMNLMYYDRFSRVLAGFSDLSEDGGDLVRLVDCGVGQTIITVQLNPPVFNAVFFNSALDNSLLFAGNIGDTISVYRFDLFTDVNDDSDPSLPDGFSLSQNYPNPFNASTEIRFSLPRAGDINLAVYNLLGQEVRTIASGRRTAGEHRLSWDGRDNFGNDCASGVYLYRLSTDEWSAGRKMLLLK